MTKKIVTQLTIIVFIIALVIIFLYLFFPKIWGDILYPLDYEESIIKYSKEYDVNPYLIAAVIYSESRYNSDAVSRAGARGLMQIMPATGASIAKRIEEPNFNPDKLFDPDTNIRYGAWYLRYLLDNYNGEINAVLAGYNGGGAVGDRYVVSREAGIPNETKGYLKTVNFALDMYKRLYPTSFDVPLENIAEKLKVEKEPTVFEKMYDYIKDKLSGD